MTTRTCIAYHFPSHGELYLQYLRTKLSLTSKAFYNSEKKMNISKVIELIFLPDLSSNLVQVEVIGLPNLSPGEGGFSFKDFTTHLGFETF